MRLRSLIQSRGPWLLAMTSSLALAWTTTARAQPAPELADETEPAELVDETQEASGQQTAETTGATEAPVGTEADAASTEAQASVEAEAFLAELEADSLGEAEDLGAIQLYGFADFSFSTVTSDSEVWTDFLGEYANFALGNVNLYMSTQLHQRWSSLIEVRYLLLPHGSAEFDAEAGTLTRTDTSAADPVEFQRPLRYGGIELERAHLDFEAFDWLKFRGGMWLTPYGIWNVDHGSPTIIAVKRPYTIGEALIPERQTGLVVHGSLPLTSPIVSYALTVSNGRGPVDSYRDFDGNKAVGGRLQVEGRWLGTATVGVSAYQGKYTRLDEGFGFTPEGQFDITQEVATQYDELGLATDLRWQFEGLLVQAEAIMNERAYVDPHRTVLSSTELRPDTRRMGAYLLLGYRTSWLGLMPYAFGEYYNFDGSNLFTPARGITMGVNIRPKARVVLKAQYYTAWFEESETGRLVTDPISMIETQAAWAF